MSQRLPATPQAPLTRRPAPAAIVAAGEAEATRRVVPDRGDVGERIDRALLRRLADVPGVSRTRIQRWIAEGRVRVAGRVPG